MNNEVIELKIKEHTEELKEHEGRINVLEKSDVKQETTIDTLCDKIDKLIIQNNKLIYTLMAGMASILIKILFFK